MADDAASQLERYRQLRQCINELRMELADEMPARVLKAGRKKLELGKLNLDPDEADMARTVLFDYCLFHYRQNGRTLLEAHFEKNPPAPGTPEARLQKALDTYRYTVFELIGPGDSEGIPCFDQLQGIGFTLMDEELARSASPQQSPLGLPSSATILASGLIWLPGYAVTTGAVLPTTPTALERIEHDLKKKWGPVEEIDFEALNHRQASDAAATVIIHCLREGAAGRLPS